MVAPHAALPRRPSIPDAAATPWPTARRAAHARAAGKRPERARARLAQAAVLLHGAQRGDEHAVLRGGLARGRVVRARRGRGLGARLLRPAGAQAPQRLLRLASLARVALCGRDSAAAASRANVARGLPTGTLAPVPRPARRCGQTEGKCSARRAHSQAHTLRRAAPSSAAAGAAARGRALGARGCQRRSQPASADDNCGGDGYIRMSTTGAIDGRKPMGATLWAQPYKGST